MEQMKCTCTASIIGVENGISYKPDEMAEAQMEQPSSWESKEWRRGKALGNTVLHHIITAPHLHTADDDSGKDSDISEI